MVFSHSRSMFFALTLVAPTLLGPATAQTVLVNPTSGQATVLPAPVANAAAASPAAAAAPVTRAGYLTLKIIVQVYSPIPQANPIICDMTPTVYGYDSATGVLDLIQERAQVVAVKSGSTATCTYNLPYNWTLYATNDFIKFGYTVSATDANGQVRSSQSGTNIIYFSAAPAGGIAVPTTNGTVTPMTAYVRL